MATSRTGTGIWKRIVKQVRAEALDRGMTHCPRCRCWLDWEYSKRPNSAEVDHVKPSATGGEDSIANAQILCRRCNQQLGDKTGKVGKRPPKVQTIDLDSSPIW